MRPRATHIILVAAALTALAILAAHATTPILYSAENISTDSHADPVTIDKRSPGDAASVIPLMGDLLGQTGTLTLTIKLKDYESAERDLARYAELSSRFDRLVITLDISDTDIGEFQQMNRQNLASLTTLLDDSQRLDDVKRLEIEVRGDEGQHAAVIYEGEVLRQKMHQGFSSYTERVPAISRIAGGYGINTTTYQESAEHFAEAAGAADEWRRETGGKTPPSPLSITLSPTEGWYGDTIQISGRYTGTPPEDPVEIYVDSRLAETVAIGDGGRYTCSYQIGPILTGPHLVYATAGAAYSDVATFHALPGNTTLTLALTEVSQATVACTGTLMTGNRSVSGAPIVLRVDGTTLFSTETNETGAYVKEVALPAGEHTIRAEFHGTGFPLHPSESETKTFRAPDELPSPLPIIAGTAALLGTVWYLRRRHQREAPEGDLPPQAPPEENEEEVETIKLPAIDTRGLDPRDAATVFFRALRARLGLAETRTPRDCARLAPDHAGFFERYERIRYAGETPTDEDLRWMEAVARGEEHAA
jgi:hypothetical protein